MEDHRYQIISNRGFYHPVVACWFPNCCLAAGTDGIWPIISGGKCLPSQSYVVILSVLGKTLKLLWGQKSIPLSSCRLSSLMLRQYHVAPSLTLVRPTPSVLWHLAIIFIPSFNNQFMPSSKHEGNLCQLPAKCRLYRLWALEVPQLPSYQMSPNLYPFLLPSDETGGTFT